MSKSICMKHLYDPSICCPVKGTWKIEIPKIPKEANYTGPPQATICRADEHGWRALGYLLLSANPECPEALTELVRLANSTQTVSQ